MSNTLKTEKQISVIHHLAEGNSIRATSRLCRVHRDTIMRILNDIGPACKNFMDLSFGNLSLRHIEIDEVWTFVGKKQGSLAQEEKDDPTIGDIYLFIALDEETKLIPAYVLGKRNWENADKIAEMLADRLVYRDALRSAGGAYRPDSGSVQFEFNSGVQSMWASKNQ